MQQEWNWARKRLVFAPEETLQKDLTGGIPLQFALTHSAPLYLIRALVDACPASLYIQKGTRYKTPIFLALPERWSWMIDQRKVKVVKYLLECDAGVLNSLTNRLDQVPSALFPTMRTYSFMPFSRLHRA